MKMRGSYMLSLAVGATLGAVAVGCGDPSDAREQGGDVPEVALTSGRLRGGNGAAKIRTLNPNGTTSSCSAVIIGDHMVATAAHCFDTALGSATVGAVQLSISAAREDGVSWMCLTTANENADGSCADTAEVRVDRLQAGNHPVSGDFAIISRNQPWQASPSLDRQYIPAELWTGSIKAGDRYVEFGAGRTAPMGGTTGDMNYLEGRVDQVSTDTLMSYSNFEQQRCKGDSGGPLMFDARDGDFTPPKGWYRVIGIQSSAQLDGACAALPAVDVGQPNLDTSPATQTATRITRDKMFFAQGISDYYPREKGDGRGWPVYACTEWSKNLWECF
jgi:hypothetical protein